MRRAILYLSICMCLLNVFQISLKAQVLIENEEDLDVVRNQLNSTIQKAQKAYDSIPELRSAIQGNAQDIHLSNVIIQENRDSILSISSRVSSGGSSGSGVAYTYNGIVSNNDTLGLGFNNEDIIINTSENDKHLEIEIGSIGIGNKKSAFHMDNVGGFKLERNDQLNFIENGLHLYNFKTELYRRRWNIDGDLYQSIRLENDDMLVIDDQTNTGLQYYGDYKSNFIDNSLISKRYADSSMASKFSNLYVTDTWNVERPGELNIYQAGSGLPPGNATFRFKYDTVSFRVFNEEYLDNIFLNITWEKIAMNYTNGNGLRLTRSGLFLEEDSIYFPNQKGVGYRLLSVSPTGALTSDSLLAGGASKVLTMPLPLLELFLADTLNGELRWYNLDKDGNLVSKHGLSGRPGQMFYALQGGIEMSFRYIKEQQKQTETLESRIKALEKKARRDTLFLIVLFFLGAVSMLFKQIITNFIKNK